MDKQKHKHILKLQKKIREKISFKFPNTKITSSFFANQYNLNNKDGNPICNETARKWLNGISVPQSHRITFLMNWLEFDMVCSTKKSKLAKSNTRIIIDRNSGLENVIEIIQKLKLNADEITIEFK
jgi:hypothetical protein